MKSSTLLVVVVLVAGLIGVDAFRHRARPAAAAGPATPASSSAAVGGPTDPGHTPIAPLPGINNADGGTPTLDLMARLATRRRIDREGTRVYLDSLFATTDSTVVRWADRGDTPLTVGFVIDSALAGWSPAAMEDVRAALRVWDGNAGNIRFVEVPVADSALVKIHWVAAISDSGRVGITNLTWASDGVVRGADITLALQENVRHSPLSASVRRMVAAHEIGHVLGLPHSADREDLMFPSAINGAPSRRDQATLQLLYAVPPGSIRGGQ